MKASYNWLKEIADFSLLPKELAHALTMAGFEVEGLEEIEGDIILDINVTPNRPDCLSITGLGREISAILEVPFKNKAVNIQKQEGKGPEVEIKNSQLCNRYASRIISGVKVAPSPEWLVKRLETHGFRTSYNIVDVTNYVLLEMGQPLHAFDLDKLADKRIVVKISDSEETFHTLDNEDRKLSKDTLLIWDSEKPVALAGIMGGLNTEVSLSTVNVLLESACFHPASIRRTSKSLNVSSESSYRFERGIDIENVVKALDMAAQMIIEISGGRVSGLTDNYPRHHASKQIIVQHEKINALLGIRIEESFLQNIMSRLGFEIKRAGEKFIVIPPSFRQDVQLDIDVIEEIARLYGYEKIPATLPSIRMQPSPRNERRDLIKSVKNSMAKSGFSEAINYSFINPEILNNLNIPSEDKRRNFILIKNPLRKEELAMRTNLIPALLNNVSLNLNRGEKIIHLFEVSSIFLHSDQKLPNEIIQLTAVCVKDKTASLWKTKHDGFYDIKGVLENLFNELKIREYYLESDKALLEPYLHPGKSCSIMISDEKLGSLGMIHPRVLEAFDIRADVGILEISNLERLQEYRHYKTEFVSLPKFPYVERDIAVIVPMDMTAEKIKREISSIDSDIIETVNLFDIYTGKPIAEDKKSLAFSIRYRASDRTLTDEEVDALHFIIIERLKDTLNAELRS